MMSTTAINDSEASQGYVYALCPAMETVGSSSAYASNLRTTLSYLSSNSSSKTRFYNTTVGSGEDKIYGLFFCRLDITDATCQKCVSLATSALNTRCPGQKVAIVWYFDQCVVRYSNASFLGTMHETPMIPMWNRENSLDIWNVTSNVTGFMEDLINTMDAAADIATSGAVDKKFATKDGKFTANLTELNTIYTLAECTPDITLSECKHCLHVTIGNISELCNLKAGCTLMCPNCNIRYDTYPFYGDALGNSSGASPGAGLQASKKKQAILTGIVIVAALLTAIAVGVLIFIRKRKPEKSDTDCNDIESVENLKFDFSVIRSATNNFSNDKKLGEGGFGEVFKGKLQNGQEIAVKRLSRNSTQGVKEFKTEVQLVAKLQHRNLVKLFGFCLAKEEKLLIYEFCPNLSLDQLLFDPTKSPSLNWETRFRIICGIGRGLLYLHEDSRLKVVHRDLKASNVLLDTDMNPKISDFGMARLFGAGETQGNTNKISGTFGYMAPEYLIAGHYSVKSDVYSFGILVLEIVSGQRNKYVRTDYDEESLLHRAWRLWNEEQVMELVDKTMEKNVSWEEAVKCIHIALLCIQEDAAKRPRMTSVVSALNGDAIVLPCPTAPHFFIPGPFGVDESATDGSGTTFTGSKNITVMDARYIFLIVSMGW
ncbi:cysteine-rich receptor-like protein kinase 25 isoform X3 [Silene latifolia]|uniref:cysteine-rich receptor-like protein kinase 25 isoform X3 n=1 Tax=Silene latifolia TaxID=37657 RepID=UPI003D778F6E